MGKGEEKQKYSAPAVKRVIDILEVMANGEGTYSVTDLASQLDIPLNSVFRILKELEGKGYVIKDNETSCYELTPKLYYLGNRMKNKISIVKVAQPFLKKVSDVTHETILLTNFGDNYSTLVLDQVESTRSIKFLSNIGSQYDSFNSAMGKAMLATLSFEMQEKYVDKVIASKHPKFHHNKQLFLDELRVGGESGVSYDDEGAIIGLYCIGCPLYSVGGKLEGAIGISGLKSRISKELSDEYSTLLKCVAKELSSALGFEG